MPDAILVANVDTDERRRSTTATKQRRRELPVNQLHAAVTSCSTDFGGLLQIKDAKQ